MITPKTENKVVIPSTVNKKIKLFYLHNFVRQDIPARDLTAEEVETYGGKLYLLATGMFAETENEQ